MHWLITKKRCMPWRLGKPVQIAPDTPSPSESLLPLGHHDWTDVQEWRHLSGLQLKEVPFNRHKQYDVDRNVWDMAIPSGWGGFDTLRTCCKCPYIIHPDIEDTSGRVKSLLLASLHPVPVSGHVPSFVYAKLLIPNIHHLPIFFINVCHMCWSNRPFFAA